VKAIVSMSLKGPFARRFLPKNFVSIATISQPKEIGSKKEDSYTGLVVDCRGLPLKPAMVPIIVDEDGHEVYHLHEQGACCPGWCGFLCPGSCGRPEALAGWF
jgi:hypothetical protein